MMVFERKPKDTFARSDGLTLSWVRGSLSEGDRKGKRVAMLFDGELPP